MRRNIKIEIMCLKKNKKYYVKITKNIYYEKEK